MNNTNKSRIRLIPSIIATLLIVATVGVLGVSADETDAEQPTGNRAAMFEMVKSDDYQGWLDIASDSSFGEDHPDVARRRRNLGEALEKINDIEGALEHYRKALSVYQEKLGENHPKTKSLLGFMLNAEKRLEKFV